MNKNISIALDVRKILNIIKEVSPGSTVELRIPGYAAIQCVAGSNHRRGTPPNTVEMSGQTLLKLIKEPNFWSEMVDSGQISASGLASDLSQIFAVAAALYEAN